MELTKRLKWLKDFVYPLMMFTTQANN